MNFWWGLARAPAALAVVLRAVFPGLKRLLAPERQSQLIAPEWIGEMNYLGEYTAVGETRQRGRFTTSADALLVFECQNGLRHAVLLESKYTESYTEESGHRGRAATYQAAFASTDGPFRVASGITIDAFRIEPFYQLMRQQLLATAMERAGEQGAATVTVLHVAPRANRAFHEGVTSPELRDRGRNVLDVWQTTLSQRARFISVSYEACFARAARAVEEVASEERGLLYEWLDYQRSRYGWEAHHA
jgi:hypothetical protein